MRRKRIRGGSGLGDAIYMRPIVEYMLRRGDKVTVCSGYPHVFDGLDVKREPFDRFNIDVLAHYTMGKQNKNTNQWEDICASAKIFVPLSFNWQVRNTELVERIRERAGGRKVIIVHGGRVPMARTDGFGMTLLPDKQAFNLVLAALADCYLVQVGKADQVYPLLSSENLNGTTSVTDLLDLGVSCDGLVGQCSFVIPIAEAFDKPLLIVWAAAGLSHTQHHYIRSITPQKVLSKKTSHYVIDDWSDEKIRGAVRAFRQL